MPYVFEAKWLIDDNSGAEAELATAWIKLLIETPGVLAGDWFTRDPDADDQRWIDETGGSPDEVRRMRDEEVLPAQ